MSLENSRISFRIASEDDSETIWGIIHGAFQEYRGDKAPLSAVYESPDHVRQALGNGREHGLICYYDGRPAGSVRFYSEEGLYFRRLGVLPEFRGLGISKAIISWLEEYARTNGESRIWCKTRTAVDRNMKLYSGMGFSLVLEENVERNGTEVGVATFSKNLN